MEMDQVILTMIERVLDEVTNDVLIAEFMKYKKITKEQLFDKVLHYEKKASRKLTLENSQLIVSDLYQDRWKNDGSHCLVYRGGRALNKNDMYKHCGRRSNNIVCKLCSTTTEGMRVKSDLMFNPEEYYNKKARFRYLAAKNICIAASINFEKLHFDKKHEFTKEQKLFPKEFTLITYGGNASITFAILGNDVMYNILTGLIFTDIQVDGVRKYMVIGVDRGDNNTGIDTIKLADLRKLKGLSDVYINYDGMDSVTAKYVTKRC